MALNTRARPSKKITDNVNWEIVDQVDKECVDRREFTLQQILSDDQFEDTKDTMIEQMTGDKVTVKYFQTSGFNKPILVKNREDLGLEVPPKFHSRDFGVEDLRSYIGARRIVDALDTKTQETKSMTMREWCQYWIVFPRKRILNGISLEFSLTKLDQHIVPPKIVRQIDWTEKAWPCHLKEMQKDYTNKLEDMMYPKVQKFVIMSVANSFMDFHLDFGGTSVWYYLLKGFKVFWMCPPTDKNLKLYESWVKEEGKKKFFGDFAEGCCRIEVTPGNTLFLPSGWIHAVFTVKDSIAFSGSFLHSFSIENQLKVNYIEDILGVLDVHRFPFFTEMCWYVLDRYVTCLTGESSLDLPEEEKKRMKLERGDHIDPNKEFLYTGLVSEAPAVPSKHVHLTQEEVRGLGFIVMYLYQKPAELRHVPDIIPEPAKLIAKVRDLVMAHKDDCPEKAVTGKYVLRWTKKDNVEINFKMKRLIPKPKRKLKHLKNPFQKNYQKAMAHQRGLAEKPNEAPKKRRRRCMECDGCKAEDCKTCPKCRDMVKYGGLGRLRQSCPQRRCLKPQLPVAAACSVCDLDAWGEKPDPKKVVDYAEHPPNLYECLKCFDIRHPECCEKQGEIISSLPNCWICSDCLTSTKEPSSTEAMETS
eukprot:TRINITY_DN8037_c0_g1_i4.p1 TRINITY_DN8037_c0_g1~~TRINITY_DN8037_c0_g1_i4.p1  ORF type:complete len:643 (+),score=120.25 TRINITY_DN8037_c0_g1_i4:74-2002(+)